MRRCLDEVDAVDAADAADEADEADEADAVGASELQPTRLGLRSRDSRPQGPSVVLESAAQFDEEDRPRVHRSSCTQSSVTYAWPFLGAHNQTHITKMYHLPQQYTLRPQQRAVHEAWGRETYA